MGDFFFLLIVREPPPLWEGGVWLYDDWGYRISSSRGRALVQGVFFFFFLHIPRVLFSPPPSHNFGLSSSSRKKAGIERGIEMKTF